MGKKAITGDFGEVVSETSRFAAHMVNKLEKRHYKGDRPNWLSKSPNELLSLLRQEVEELDEAIYENSMGYPEVLSECCDVANFAMMVADSYEQNGNSGS